MHFKGIYLDKKGKEKLIEILLIIGSILAAFGYPEFPVDLVWIFMLFLLMSISYYIFLQSPKKNPKLMLFISAFISLMFSSIIVYNIATSLILSNKLNLNPGLIMVIAVVSVIYYLIFSFLITAALYNEVPDIIYEPDY